MTAGERKETRTPGLNKGEFALIARFKSFFLTIKEVFFFEKRITRFILKFYGGRDTVVYILINKGNPHY